MTTREGLYKLIESIPQELFDQVSNYLRIMSEEPEELTEQELRAVEEAEEQVKRGEVYKWRDIRRKDV